MVDWKCNNYLNPEALKFDEKCYESVIYKYKMGNNKEYDEYFLYLNFKHGCESWKEITVDLKSKFKS